MAEEGDDLNAGLEVEEDLDEALGDGNEDEGDEDPADADES